MGNSGTPMTISASQTVSNKTLDNTNTITVKDSLFTLQDNSDVTKQAQFQLSGITTGTTRTYTLPNASSTLVDIATTQTLASKTLTGPVINGGTIDNSTVTVDAIAGHTSATSGTIYGVSVTSGTIAAAGLASNSVITAKIQDAAVTPAKLIAGTGSTWVWQSWVPTWTNLTVGSGTVTASYIQIGKTVFFKVKFVYGAGSAVGTAPAFTLPVTSTAVFTSNNILGGGLCDDTGVAGYPAVTTHASTTTAGLAVQVASGTYTSLAGVTATVPFTWAAGDIYSAGGFYEAA